MLKPSTLKEAIKEPRQVKAETTQYVDKHQVQQQPGLFAAKRPKGVIFTMHHQVNNPQANPNHQQEGYELKDTNPQLGERWPNGGGYGRRWWMSGESSITGGCDLYAEVKLGNYKGRTKHFEKKMNPEWKQVFAFSKECIHLPGSFCKRDGGKRDYLGREIFDLNEVPSRVPPDSPLAPQWYRLEDRRGGKVKGDIMVADQVHPSKDDVLGRTSLPLNILRSGLTTGRSTLASVTLRSLDLVPWKLTGGIAQVLKCTRASANEDEGRPRDHRCLCCGKASTRFSHWKGTNSIVNPKSSSYLYAFLPTTCSASIWAVLSDELDEEFDTFPTSKQHDVVRMRYNRLRSVAGRIQTMVGDIGTQGERFHSLLGWRDPRATSLFIVFCLFAAVVLYVTCLRWWL
ncbi:FT-interacting protein [Actinidia chinensis var. chinensis]|uniref:FT-interacting protein n=1 Tax=Actinidia chinensis var. chinensis TaxID=1590841 RepID=A0A2R6QMF3_ACTCC|nr:FT-interacting protein [Actinidia chinensis var. chinensis]